MMKSYKRIFWKRIFTISLLLISFSSRLVGQENFTANRLCDRIQLDGKIDEPEWMCSDTACNFTVSYPNFGTISPFESYVRILYDDEAIYVGGILSDPSPDSISYSLSQRDDFGNGDWFSIRVDPYATNQTAFLFGVTAAGVEIDAIEYIDDTDYTWNAVWKSSTQRRNDGWSFEFRIPFSAIRFPDKDIQEWHVNLGRQVRRNRETSYWNPLDPNVYGEITQSGKLKGIADIKSPLRLSLTPYLTGYLENSYSSAAGKQVWNRRVTGGLDLKYGVNQAFTIDMTLIPDFGQTRSDQQVLNLSPFEIRYNENRPFFLEGMDLFRIGGVFYTRRVGGVPYNLNLNLKENEELRSLPLESPIINGSKFSGRTASGLGIGVFNGLEGRAFATVADTTGAERQVEVNPLSNYNVLVLSQNMKNNSVVSFVNTNVLREGEARDANVSVLSTSIFSQDNNYKIDAVLKQSTISENGSRVMGHSMYTGFAKVAGIWRYGLSYTEDSDTYNPNDLGYLAVNNKRAYNANLRWNDFTSGKYFLRRWATLSLSYNELFKPQLYSSFNIDWSYTGTFRNFLTAGINGGITPFGYTDHFESRTFGKEISYGPSVRFGGFYSSDYSKPFALDLRGSYTFYTENSQDLYSLTISPRVRFSDRMFIVWNTTFQGYHHDLGYVSQDATEYVQDRIILGRRNRLLIENTLSGEYIFTNRMGLDIQFRHYWQQVKYNEFTELGVNSSFNPTSYNPQNVFGESVHNTSYNAFTLDLNFRWVFYPGCQLLVVYKNNIFQRKDFLDSNYFNTFESLFQQPQINSLSMKLLVYIDALYFRSKKSRLK